MLLFLTGFSLTGFIISSLQVTDLFDCSFACLQEYHCLSFNFKEIPDPFYLCQLSSERNDTKPGNYHVEGGMTYYDAHKVRMKKIYINKNINCRTLSTTR